VPGPGRAIVHVRTGAETASPAQDSKVINAPSYRAGEAREAGRVRRRRTEAGWKPCSTASVPFQTVRMDCSLRAARLSWILLEASTAQPFLVGGMAVVTERAVVLLSS